MKITIDTKHDSHDEMQHAIDILTNIIRKQQRQVPAAAPVESPGMMNMFAEPSPEPVEAKPDTAPDFTSFLNLAKNAQQEKDADPKVELF